MENNPILQKKASYTEPILELDCVRVTDIMMSSDNGGNGGNGGVGNEEGYDELK